MEAFERVLEILGFHTYFRPTIATFLVGLSCVYLTGRMLDVVKKDRFRNLIAAISMLAFAILNVFGLIPAKVLDALMIFTGGVVVYVLVGFRLFDRINKYQDRKLEGKVKSA